MASKVSRLPSRSSKAFLQTTTCPLNKADGSVATWSSEKAEVLATHLSNKITVPDLEHHRPASRAMPHLTYATLNKITIICEVVKQLHLVKPKKELRPDGLSRHILKHCTAQLAAPVTAFF